MAERQFRFRLPWLLAGPPRPAAEPQPPRPTVGQIQAPPQPTTTTIPIQQPPFRPAGIAPIQPPPAQPQAPQRSEPQPLAPRATTESQVSSQPASPSRATVQSQAASVPSSPSQAVSESRVTSQPASPSRATVQPQAASVPSSPSLAVSESRVTSLPASPSRATSQDKATTQTRSPSRASPQSRATSVPPSPSRTRTQPQSAMQVGPQSPSQSPSRLASQHADLKSPGTSSPSRMATQEQATVSQKLSPSKKLQVATQETSKPLPSAPQQEEPKPAVSPLSLQESEPKKEPTRASSPVTTTTPEPVTKEVNEKEREKATEKLIKEEKTISPTHEEPKMSKTTRHLTAASGSGKQTKEFRAAAIHAEQGMKEKEDGLESKKAIEEQIKTVSSTHPRARSTLVIPSGEPVTLQKEIREDISRFINKLGASQPKQPIDDKQVSIITLAGENKGASMHLGSKPAKKEESVHIHRGYKLNPDESTEATTDAEESSKGKSPKNSSTKDEATKAYINSNIQSINNSILFESSVNARNPGVHLDLSYNPPEATKSSTKPEPLKTQKAEFNITPAEKHAYEPTIRRRCLRGLFLETSDSEPDKPEKPRRHGCRYSCEEKSKDKDIGVF